MAVVSAAKLTGSLPVAGLHHEVRCKDITSKSEKLVNSSQSASSMESAKAHQKNAVPVGSSGNGMPEADASTHALDTGAVLGSTHRSTTLYEHFEILRREDGSLWSLGAGAMGQTFKALDTRLRCTVALKVIQPGLLGRSAATHERFLREARTAASVHHPNIARVFHLGTLTDGQAFYAMEFVDGMTVAEWVGRYGPLPILLALEMTLQVTRALIAAAESDLIHRDIKPANLMLTRAGLAACETWSDRDLADPEHAVHSASGPPLVKVIDFGLARTSKQGLNGPLTLEGDFVGTPQFASPEQFGQDTETIDSRSDIFSLGCTLWFLLVGCAPFGGSSFEEVQRAKGRALPVKTLRAAAVPPPVVELLKAMLARDANKRPQTPTSLAKAIVQCRRELLANSELLHNAALGLRGSRLMPGSVPAWRRVSSWTVLATVILLSVSGMIWGTSSHPKEQNPTQTGLAATKADPIPAAPTAPEQSVAVLPFTNLSDDRGNAYFTEGVQESILTRLAKLASLKVTSGSSTQLFKAQPTNLAEIGRQLGVTYFLQGSVQKAGNAVRVNVQLVRAATAEHVWAENYDRAVDNLFSVESEVAQTVADRLHAQLSGREQRALSTQPTRNPQAYDHYLRGLAFMLRPYTRLDDSAEAVKSFQEAVRLDPDFALAWAWLGRAAAFTYLRQYYDPHSVMPDIARTAARRALELQPDLGEAVLAQGYVLYYCDRDYSKAAGRFEQAHRLLPNDSKPLEAHGLVSRRQGYWKQSLKDLAQALTLDPHDANLVFEIAEGYADLRMFDDALKFYSLGHDFAPDGNEAWFQMADIQQARGDLPAAATLLARTHPMPNEEPNEKQLEQWLYERRFDAGIAALKQVLAQTNLDPEDRTRAQAHLAWFEEYAGDAVAARQGWAEVRAALQPTYREDTRDTLHFAWLAFARAALGDRDGAMSLARNLYTNAAAGGNLIEAPGVEEILARVLVRTGQLDEAAAIVESLLTKPYIGMLNASHPLTRASLRLDPQWDPLRKEKRFGKLFSGPEISSIFN